jgi:hypothetical protein
MPLTMRCPNCECFRAKSSLMCSGCVFIVSALKSTLSISVERAAQAVLDHLAHAEFVKITTGHNILAERHV